ncbi:hypothetical protein BB737_11915 [Mycobacterium avium subsp. hominissuis]|uniref:hypothetical protein n=1 Tax=Mycobacterium avium TaxID=1764 RepID=UPI0003D1EAA3|nr:hypothetical protein [Mycobacterium avium]ETA96251.1 hypothetical protein O982_16950 [Mycobacterium avium 10-5581]ATO62485.1 hypothetical protein BEP52_09380 [Mycobacterium avium subsp. hominissuis]ATO67010.1 hypothetical protein BJP78_09105 [Mycobacterium avium subsp. hominissuis]ATO71547.1 hypothetical protein BJP74_08920 [Mycobacterium avium subsp. hominissuis]PBJ35921.1 hypothetical protein BI294_13760 [Mycobacterium avium subsp. hominissuis]
MSIEYRASGWRVLAPYMPSKRAFWLARLEQKMLAEGRDGGEVATVLLGCARDLVNRAVPAGKQLAAEFDYGRARAGLRRIFAPDQ